MSRHAYQVSREISAGDPPFQALIMAAMRQADTANRTLLQAAWPETWTELSARYSSPGGLLPGEPGYDELTRARMSAAVQEEQENQA
jgi:hypothetical protein